MFPSISPEVKAYPFLRGWLSGNSKVEAFRKGKDILKLRVITPTPAFLKYILNNAKPSQDISIISWNP
jgi:hypothetical protein